MKETIDIQNGEMNMEEKSGVLIQNEKQANKAVAKVMRITFLILRWFICLMYLGFL